MRYASTDGTYYCRTGGTKFAYSTVWPGGHGSTYGKVEEDNSYRITTTINDRCGDDNEFNFDETALLENVYL